jgi:hypothetical protein
MERGEGGGEKIKIKQKNNELSIFFRNEGRYRNEPFEK